VFIVICEGLMVSARVGASTRAWVLEAIHPPTPVRTKKVAMAAGLASVMHVLDWVDAGPGYRAKIPATIGNMVLDLEAFSIQTIQKRWEATSAGYGRRLA